MSVEFRYAEVGEYSRVSRFLNEYWAKDHVYVRMPQLFEWTFRRENLWDYDGYSFALAEDKGQIVGALGGIPFIFNYHGRGSSGVWLVNYLIRPDYRRGPMGVRLLSTFRRPPYEAVVAFGSNTSAIHLYRLLRWKVLEDMPRHFLVLPQAEERMVHLLRLAQPAWSEDRAKSLAHCFCLTVLPRPHVASVNILPPTWDKTDWPCHALNSIGAVRDVEYLTWRYLRHPSFHYRFIAVPEGKRTGLAVWRLEKIHRVTPLGVEEVDQIGRILEFLPVSRTNTRDLLSMLLEELEEAHALGADFYNYHSEINTWLTEAGFPQVTAHPDGSDIPSRFQPLDSRGGRLQSALFMGKGMPVSSMDQSCAWYWTKSDSDQDRPN